MKENWKFKTIDLPNNDEVMSFVGLTVSCGLTKDLLASHKKVLVVYGTNEATITKSRLMQLIQDEGASCTILKDLDVAVGCEDGEPSIANMLSFRNCMMINCALSGLKTEIICVTLINCILHNTYFSSCALVADVTVFECATTVRSQDVGCKLCVFDSTSYIYPESGSCGLVPFKSAFASFRLCDMRNNYLMFWLTRNTNISGSMTLNTEPVFRMFEFDRYGMIVYKRFGSTTYPAPEYWKIAPESVIREPANQEDTACQAGVNVGSASWVLDNHLQSDIWKCRIPFADLPFVVIASKEIERFVGGEPTIKIRSNTVVLLEKIKPRELQRAAHREVKYTNSLKPSDFMYLDGREEMINELIRLSREQR